jgi:hypothetical protein
MAKATKRVSTQRKTASKKPTPKKLSQAQTIINSLPFQRKGVGKGKSDHPWWVVKPSGDYATNLETGRRYARAFLPLLEFNVGPAALGWIVADMALVGHAEKGRAIDDIALGFMIEIGGILQSAMGAISIATVAIENPDSDLGPKFAKLVKAGEALKAINRQTLFHDPDAHMFEPYLDKKRISEAAGLI